MVSDNIRRVCFALTATAGRYRTILPFVRHHLRGTTSLKYVSLTTRAIATPSTTAQSNTFAMSDTSKTYDIAIHWFRNGLRFHDNPSLLDASKSCRTLIPLVIIDPEYPFCQTADRRAGCIRVNFILESLTELQNKLEMMGSQLMVVQMEEWFGIFQQ